MRLRFWVAKIPFFPIPSSDARIRTLSASFGGSLLSQEHTPVDNTGPGQAIARAGSCFTNLAQLSIRTPWDA